MRVKNGRYIKPVFESGDALSYTIRAEGGYDIISSESITVLTSGAGVIGQAIIGTTPIGGTGVQSRKFPLRWRGEQMRLTVTTDTSAGPDVITGYTVYGNIFGRR